ncbi:hypothetical protein [Methyloversatilis discipulorum]|jgi:hypothetical protein|uniref:hypothetical protein n=1 Tax=Methyloversatilis discipulorum TaxID=1119528 RepID=UPI003F67E021
MSETNQGLVSGALRRLVDLLMECTYNNPAEYDRLYKDALEQLQIASALSTSEADEANRIEEVTHRFRIRLMNYPRLSAESFMYHTPDRHPALAFIEDNPILSGLAIGLLWNSINKE